MPATSPHPASATDPQVGSFPHDRLRTIADLLESAREDLLAGWQEAIGRSGMLQAREDINDQAGVDSALLSLYDVVRRELLTPESYASLKDYIESAGILHFTPDAACRLQLALKETLLARIDAGPEISPDQRPAIRDTAGRAMDEILLRLAEFYHNARYERVRDEEGRRSRGLKAAQDRLQTLLETMNQGFTATSASETITLFNRRMEEITGFSREEVLNRHVSCIYPPEAHDRLLSQIARRKQGEASSYEIELQHKNGARIPVRISGAPLRDDYGHFFGSFAVITDITHRVQAERELRQRNEQVSLLLEKESRRAAYFSTISQVAQLALVTLDPDEIFSNVVQAIQRHFDYNHTSLFLTDPETDEVVLRARSGDYEPFFQEGYRQKVGAGIVGKVVESGHSILANDVTSDPRRIVAFPEERISRAELCVPIRVGDRIMGALDVQSSQADVFDENDQSALEALADQIAWAIHNARQFQETRQLKEFNDQILESIPLPVVLMNRKREILYANLAYQRRHGLDLDAIVNRPLETVIPDSALALPDGREALEKVFKTGEQVLLERTPGRRLEYRNRIVNIVLNRIVVDGDTPLAIAVVEDITESLEKAYQSSLLRQIGQTMQGILDIDRLLYAILTCVTAGTALGFNRAILLLVPRRNVLEGKMGVGPANRESAGRILHEMATKNPTLEDILRDYDRMEDPADVPVVGGEADSGRPVAAPGGSVLVDALKQRLPIVVQSGDSPRSSVPVDMALWAALGSGQFVAVPLVSREKAIGVIVADNLYSGKPITQDSVDLLSAFASHAALAIENAELYRQLEEKIAELERTQEELVQSERLAIIGEMSARMAHEIRNPLTTIGGFARSVQRNPDPDRVRKASDIIVEEVERLEDLLAETLSFTRPPASRFAACDLGEICSDVVEMLEEQLSTRGVALRYIPDGDLPPVQLDENQIRQVLINLVQNAAQAMPDGGTITLSARVGEPPPHNEDAPVAEADDWVCVDIEDTGEGIPQDRLKDIFSPFFTTKTYGTGLGLTISRKIVHDHRGDLVIRSEEGKGTIVSLCLPVTGPDEGDAPT